MIEGCLLNLQEECNAFRREADKTVAILDDMTKRQTENYNRISEILADIMKSLDEIGRM